MDGKEKEIRNCPLSGIIRNIHASTHSYIESAMDEMEEVITRCKIRQPSDEKLAEGISKVSELQEIGILCKNAQNKLIAAMRLLEGHSSFRT